MRNRKRIKKNSRRWRTSLLPGAAVLTALLLLAPVTFAEDVDLAPVYDTIDSFGSILDVRSLDEAYLVENARAQFDSLSQTQQRYISADDQMILLRAENKIAELSGSEMPNLEAVQSYEGSAASTPSYFLVDTSSVESWRGLVIEALSANGLDPTADRVQRVLVQILTESGGNPSIVQTITDSNQGWKIEGHHCDKCAAGDGHYLNIGHGLLQTIPTTFEAYKFEGHDDIFNPYDNLLSAINYAKNRYGDNLSGMGNGTGF